MKTVQLVLMVSIASILTLVSGFKKSTPTNYSTHLMPPGTVKVTPNFYCDAAEITNNNWREYMYWTGRIFGFKSREYLLVLPDTNAWTKYDTNLTMYAKSYLKNISYNDYPVVGVSQQQAINFGKWRSDRVFEFILVKFGKIKFSVPQQNRTNYFTIERYMTGNFNNIVPDTNFSYYPSYTLPTEGQVAKIVSYTDSINTNHFKKQRCKLYQNTSQNIRITTMPATVDCTTSKNNKLLHLNDNVAEWLFEKQTATGNNWATHDTLAIVTQRMSNCYTGFRNVCTWRKWAK